MSRSAQKLVDAIFADSRIRTEVTCGTPVSGVSNPTPAEYSVAEFRRRFVGELERLRLTYPMVAIILNTCGLHNDTVAGWCRAHGDLPDVASLLRLATVTRIDLVYVMTGQRGID